MDNVSDFQLLMALIAFAAFVDWVMW